MASATGKPNRGLLTAAIAVLVLGVLAATGLWFAAGQRYDDAVNAMARAPLGCDTTLDFADGGSFILFVETTGSIDDVPGDCSTSREYSSSAEATPPVRVTLLGPDGEEVALDRDSGITYDTAGFVGASIRTFEVANPGDHVLRVESESTDFAVAVGRDPNDGVGLLKTGAIAALIGSLAAFAVLMFLARRKKTVGADLLPGQAAPGQAIPGQIPGVPPAGGLADSAGWVTTPPSMQPPQSQPVQPEYGQFLPAQSHPAQSQPTQPQYGQSQPASAEPQSQQYEAHQPSDVGWQPDDSGSSGDGERSPWAPPTDGPQ